MSVFPGLRAHSQGKGIVLTFDDDVGGALKKACDYDNDAVHLAQAAEVVHNEIFEMNYSFDGSFKLTYEHDAVPPSLMALVSMILDDPASSGSLGVFQPAQEQLCPFLSF